MFDKFPLPNELDQNDPTYSPGCSGGRRESAVVTSECKPHLHEKGVPSIPMKSYEKKNHLG